MQQAGYHNDMIEQNGESGFVQASRNFPAQDLRGKKRGIPEKMRVHTTVCDRTGSCRGPVLIACDPQLNRRKIFGTGSARKKVGNTGKDEGVYDCIRPNIFREGDTVFYR